MQFNQKNVLKRLKSFEELIKSLNDKVEVLEKQVGVLHRKANKPAKKDGGK